MTHEAKRWMPFIALVLCMGGYLAQTDEEVALEDPTAKASPVVAPAAPPPSHRAEEMIDDGRADTAIATSRYREVSTPVVEEAAAEEELLTAFAGGRIRNLQHDPVEIDQVIALRNEGEIADWQQSILRGTLTQHEQTVVSNDTFRVPVRGDEVSHLAINAGGRWWLIEGVQPGSESLVIEVPLETKRPSPAPAVVSATVRDPWRNVTWGAVIDDFEPTARNFYDDGHSNGLRDVRISFSGLAANLGTNEVVESVERLGERLPTEREWTGSPYSPLVNGTSNVSASNGDDHGNDGSVDVGAGAFYVIDNSAGAFYNDGATIYNRTQIVGNVVTDHHVDSSGPGHFVTPTNFNPVNPDQNGGSQTIEPARLAAIANPNTITLRLGNSWIATEELELVDVSVEAPFDQALWEEYSSAPIEAPRRPTCLRTRAFDEQTGDEFYAWDLVPQG